MSSRPIPQISSGRLVSLTVDNPQYYTQSHAGASTTTTEEKMPALVPAVSADAEEKTMLWRNVSTLFAKCDENDERIQSLTRGSDDLLQGLNDVREEVTQVHKSNRLTKCVRKIKKYVNKKCEKVRGDISYSSFSANDEVFAYINKIRGEFDEKIQALEAENTRMKREMADLHQTYDSDYEMFVRRENDLMSQLGAAVHASESLSDRVKDYEGIVMRQLVNVREDSQQHVYNMAGDLREEFARAISREMETESKTTTEMVKHMNEELVDLITRSNQYHSHRYFGTVEDIKQLRDNGETLKKSIGMVDAELSETKEMVEFLKDEVGQASNDIYDLKENMREMKDDIYHEMDRDYYDMKGYIRHKIHQHKKQMHATKEEDTGLQMIVNEYADPDITVTVTDAAAVVAGAAEGAGAAVQAVAAADTHEQNVIIIDADTVISDDEDKQPVKHT